MPHGQVQQRDVRRRNELRVHIFGHQLRRWKLCVERWGVGGWGLGVGGWGLGRELDAWQLVFEKLQW
jgi:hypothetical protein